jgi:hypothetical protein
MKMTNLRKLSATLGAAALVLTGMVAITPAAHAAAPTCLPVGKDGVTTCVGKLANDAAYVVKVPANFGGTMYYWNHGFRPSYPYPTYTPPKGVEELTPGNSVTKTDVTAQMLAAGYGVAAYDRVTTGLHGWNTAESVEMLKELMDTIKAKFTTIKKSVVYGSSGAAPVIDMFVEKYPAYADSVGIMAGLTPPAGNEVKSLCDAFYILSVFADPTIKGCAAMGVKGPNGHLLALQEFGKVVTLLKGWSADYGAQPLAYPAAITPYGIPQRSALLLTGLLIGLPAKSAHMDGISTSALVPEQSINATVAILENLGDAIGTGTFAGQAISEITGPGFYDNTKTDWASLLSDEDSARYNLGLSGDDGIAAMIGTLQAAPRVKGDPAAIAKLNALDAVKFTSTKPTVLLSNEADRLVFPGNTALYVDKAKAAYDARLADYQAGKTKVKPVWNTLAMYAMTPETYTTFDASGAPVLTAKATSPSGTGHQTFSATQTMAWVKMLAQSAKYGKIPNTGFVVQTLKQDKYLNLDPDYRPADLKYNN